MLNPIVSSIVYLTEMLVVCVFYSRISENKVSIGKCLLVGFLLFEVASVVNVVFKNNVVINTGTSLVACFLFAVLCFEIRLFSSLFLSLLLVVANFILEILVILMYSSFANGKLAEINYNPMLLLLAVITNKTILFILCLLLSKGIRHNNIRVKIPSIMLIYPLALAVGLVIFWQICLTDGVSEQVQQGVAAVCGIFFIATVGLFLIYQNQVMESTQHIQMENELKRLQQEQLYYKILEQQNENLMIYAHDAKKHLAAIASLTSDPAISEYIGKLSNQLKSYSKNCHSGNRLLDVMIHKYNLDCESKRISFYYDVLQCNLNEVQDIDLVAIVGNLMDNAVCAAAESTEKQIALETTSRNGYSVLIISNSCDASPVCKGSQFISSKVGFHGYGLKSVLKTIKKYQGDLNWEYDEQAHTFTITVMIGNQSSIR